MDTKNEFYGHFYILQSILTRSDFRNSLRCSPRNTASSQKINAMGLRPESGGSNVTDEDGDRNTERPVIPCPNTSEEVQQPSDLPKDKEPVSPSGSDIGIPKSPQNQSLAALAEAPVEEGYDTDGKLRPFFEGVEDEGSLEGVPEEEIGGETQNADNNTAAVEVNGEAENSENLNGAAPALTVEIVNGMGVKDLRVELGKRGLSKKGRKRIWLTGWQRLWRTMCHCLRMWW